MNEIDNIKIYNDIKEYCERYNIPIENFIDILEDQKVLPMIRGKATEYIAAVVLKKVLGRNWQVQKLNLNAQTGTYDEDISITHSKTGIRMKVEAKNAVRASFKTGTTRTRVKVPHFKVKCHRSRSNISKSTTTNDRYMVTDFDLIVCNVSNAIFQGATLGDHLEILHNDEAISLLKEYYGVQTKQEIIRKAYDDWRGCFPRAIVQSDHSIPRTPTVQMIGDDHWFSIEDLEPKLLPELELIKNR
ncbi:MAG: hypothetical protein HAW67_07505 [Endozoicomonadaceae bacterium]|nr:hypothetical protein [Endozoicomonadaceae bacterium]